MTAGLSGESGAAIAYRNHTFAVAGWDYTRRSITQTLPGFQGFPLPMPTR